MGKTESTLHVVDPPTIDAVTGSHTIFEVYNTNVVANHSSINGNKNVIHGSHNRITGRGLTIHGSHNRIETDRSCLIGSHLIIHGSSNLVGGDHNSIDGSANTIKGCHNRVCGIANLVYGSHNRLNGDHNKAGDGDHNTLHQPQFVIEEFERVRCELAAPSIPVIDPHVQPEILPPGWSPPGWSDNVTASAPAREPDAEPGNEVSNLKLAELSHPMSGELSCNLFQMEVPYGCAEGSVLTVRTPTCQLMEVTVPPGLHAGDQFLVAY